MSTTEPAKPKLPRKKHPVPTRAAEVLRAMRQLSKKPIRKAEVPVR